LSAWISHQKTPSTLRTIFPSPGSLTPGEERETTVGFLKLPGKHHKEDASVYTSEDQYSSDGERRYTYDSTLSMLVDPKALEISKEQRSRFARAMQALGLEPFVHPTQLIAPGHKWFRVGKSKHSMERVFLCKGHNKPHSTQYPDAIEKEHDRIEEHVKSKCIADRTMSCTDVVRRFGGVELAETDELGQYQLHMVSAEAPGRLSINCRQQADILYQPSRLLMAVGRLDLSGSYLSERPWAWQYRDGQQAV